MRIDILTIFPDIFTPLKESIIKRAQEKRLVEIKVHNLRDFTHDKHKKVDDEPYGGGKGMVMKPEPIYEGIEYIVQSSKLKVKNSASQICVKGSNRRRTQVPKVILLSPKGSLFTQKIAKNLSEEEHLVFICGHYEGVDERVKKRIDLEISIGDYILTGGELPAMVIIDAICRLIPGVLPQEAVEKDSFSDYLLDFPAYTRPSLFRKMRVPSVLLSGNHKKIEEWREKKAASLTRKCRPDLYKLFKKYE